MLVVIYIVNLLYDHTTMAKGNQVLIPELGSVTVGSLVSHVVTRLELETSVRTLGRVVFSA